MLDFYDVGTLRHTAGLSQESASHLYGVSVRTWRRWERSPNPPKFVLRSLRFLAGHLPGWNGYCIRNGFIITPSGEEVKASHIGHFWWLLGLACDMHRKDHALIKHIHNIATAA